MRFVDATAGRRGRLLAARLAQDGTHPQHGQALANRAPRSGGFFVHGWNAVGLGAVLVAGVLLAVGPSAAEIFARRLVDWDSDWWMRAWAAAFVALAGLAVLVHGVRDLRRVARVRLFNAAYPAEPWRWDYEWDERRSVDEDTMRRARLYTGMGIGLLLLMAPWVPIIIALIAGRAPLIMKAGAVFFAFVIVLFTIVALAILSSGVGLVWRRLKYGQGLATFARFPFRRGEELELHVQAPRSLPQHAVVTAILRCIEDRYVTTTKRDGETLTSVECFELYRASGPAELVTTSKGSRALRVRFTIPANAPTTVLASRPCRYWEVDLNAASDGVDYGARFLVPVY